MTNLASPAPSAVGGADLLRALGLLVDGPGLWGRHIAANKPGVFVIELPAAHGTVQIDPTAVRAWLERVPDLRLDGHQPTVGELQARLASFWLPDQTIVYVGASSKSVASRVANMARTDIGDRRPQSAGYWLKTLPDLARARIWWALTDDPELYEDAALDEFVRVAGQLPFAVLATPSGKRKDHGLTNALRDNPDAPPAPSKRTAAEARSAELAGARAARLGVRRSALDGSEPDPEAARRAAARAPKLSPKATPKSPAQPKPTPAGAAPAGPPPAEPVFLSASGLAGLQSELDELTTKHRPEVVARIRAARELGDLSENADYESARKEQSFLEGRIQQIEQLIKNVSVIDESQLGHEVVLGSTVVVDTDRHGEETFTIVGSAEADAAAGRISYTSPLGRALLGKRAGSTIQVSVPAGKMEYRIVEVR